VEARYRCIEAISADSCEYSGDRYGDPADRDPADRVGIAIDRIVAVEPVSSPATTIHAPVRLPRAFSSDVRPRRSYFLFMQARHRDEGTGFEQQRVSGVMPVRRKNERKETALAVRVRQHDGTVCHAVISNLSIGGGFIETPTPAAFGALVVLVVPLPGFPEGAEIEATVRWTNPSGMGVQFGLMGARLTHALTEILRF
jgi:Tfp pilus assembly protein PilZ